MVPVVRLDEAIVQLARLGLKGDQASVNRLVRKLLREFAVDPEVPMQLKDALAKLIAAEPSQALRFADVGGLGGALPYLRVEHEIGADEPLLAPDIEALLAAIVDEHRNRERLETAGILPTRTVLLTGPPGVGKTMAARALARRLELPLMAIDLSMLMSSYLGKTGQNLRDVFTAARSEPSVLLLDEFDAVAKRRDDPGDVGELKRIVNVLLIELEAHSPAGVVVAATNHPELLDRAIWRRFERVVTFGLPTPDVRRALIERELAKLSEPARADAVELALAATEGASCSDSVLLARKCVRRVLLERKDVNAMLAQESIHGLRTLAHVDSRHRALYCRVAAEHLGRTQRALGAELGISHVMVGRLIKQATPGPNARSRKKEDGHG